MDKKLQKTLLYKSKCFDSDLCQANKSNLDKNLFEEIHKTNCKYRYDSKNVKKISYLKEIINNLKKSDEWKIHFK